MHANERESPICNLQSSIFNLQSLPPLFLASASPRRRQLLRRMGLRFKVLKPTVDESGTWRSPREHAIRLAEMKARAVAPPVRKGIIIAVDTIVVLGREIMGKPMNRADARRMIKALAGRTHRVIGGLCLLRQPDGRTLLACEETKVQFRRLSPAEIDAYVATDEPYDKAGAYAIQGQAGFFVERIEGDYFNVVGLPVARLLKLLQTLSRRSSKS